MHYLVMVRRLCVVCGVECERGLAPHDVEIHDREHPGFTVWGLCPEHRTLQDLGWIAIVECDAEKSGNPEHGARVASHQVHRMGRYLHISRNTFTEAFERDLVELPVVYVAVPAFETVLKFVRDAMKPS